MSSPHDDSNVEQWFRRFNAPLKSLPAEERAELHQEVRQHLDALVAANEELGSLPQEAWEHALTQFGDPSKIGRRLRREALTLPHDPNRWNENPLVAAWLYCSLVCFTALATVWVVTMFSLSILWIGFPTQPESGLWHFLAWNVLGRGGIVASSALAGWRTGRKMKANALAGAFYALFSLGVSEALLLLFIDHNGSGAAGWVA